MILHNFAPQSFLAILVHSGSYLFTFEMAFKKKIITTGKSETYTNTYTNKI